MEVYTAQDTLEAADQLPRIHRDLTPEQLQALDVSHYKFFQRAALAKRAYDSQGQPMGAIDGGTPLPPDSLEKIMATDCDTLAGIFDGSIIEPHDPNKSPYLDGQPRSTAPIDSAVYLDKSARPVSALMRELWPYLSAGKLPDSHFVNIDKESYLYLMGFGQNGENIESVPQEAISLDLIEPAARRDMVLRIRAMYLLPEDRDRLLTPEVLAQINSELVPMDQLHPLEPVWELPVRFTGKHVAIIDEVKSSGSTLRIADMLYREALPDATLEPLYWSVPNRIYWNNGSEFANEYTPVWYSKERATGRGGIGGVDIDRSSQAEHPTQQVGAPLLSTAPVDEQGNRRRVDRDSQDVRHDIHLFAERFGAGLVRYEPSRHRDEQDYEQRLDVYYRDN